MVGRAAGAFDGWQAGMANGPASLSNNSEQKSFRPTKRRACAMAGGLR